MEKIYLELELKWSRFKILSSVMLPQNEILGNPGDRPDNITCSFTTKFLNFYIQKFDRQSKSQNSTILKYKIAMDKDKTMDKDKVGSPVIFYLRSL